MEQRRHHTKADRSKHDAYVRQSVQAGFVSNTILVIRCRQSVVVVHTRAALKDNLSRDPYEPISDVLFHSRTP